jgi:hypothetical protein
MDDDDGLLTGSSYSSVLLLLLLFSLFAIASWHHPLPAATFPLAAQASKMKAHYATQLTHHQELPLPSTQIGLLPQKETTNEQQQK